MRLFFHKLFHWEYWPFHAIYFPVFFVWAYYSVKEKSIFFFNASNPKIKNGGFINESKMQIYKMIPPSFYPETILITTNETFECILQKLKASGIKYPLIAKPDIGLRGSAVKKIHTQSKLESYHKLADFGFLIQELIPFENEIGIFYVRYPNEKNGRITGIVAKEFVIIEGDGKSTMEQLIRKNPRFELQLKVLKLEYGGRMSEVIPLGEKINLVPYGNHVRGAKFIDASHLITEKLTHVIDSLCRQIDGFYFGRLDLMYKSIEALENGEDFLIVELNGAASEPTHIYDPKHSIWFAWRELIRHIRYMYEISVLNHKNGAPYLSHKKGMEEYRIHLANNKKILNFRI